MENALLYSIQTTDRAAYMQLGGREGRKKKEGRKQVFLYLTTYSFTSAGLQMPKVSLALRFLTLMREIILKDYRSHTWNQNVTKLAAGDLKELDLAKEPRM